MRALLVAPAILALALAVAGCDDDPAGRPTPGAVFTPTLTDTECPAQVDNVLMSHYSCQLLTVAGGIEVLVTRIDPESGPARDDPLVMVGEEYGTTINYAGQAAVPDRVGRTTYFLNGRGIAGSHPDLSCPEVDELATDILAGGGAESGRSSWLEAVQQCHDRLVDSGVELAAYGSDSMAGDVLALVRALGVDTWEWARGVARRWWPSACSRRTPPGWTPCSWTPPSCPMTTRD